MENKIYSYWLCSVPGVGNKTIEKLQNTIGSAEQIYHAAEEKWAQVLNKPQLEEMKLHKQSWKLWEEYKKMTEQGIRFLLREDADYPKRLLHIPDAPYGIFLKGHLPHEDKLSVAIIGARDCSEYGRYVAVELGKYLGERGIQVISGMARGIDSISQEAALQAGGVSFAVLGNGVDVCYPAQNRKLYEQIQKKGGILSIYPPGTVPRPQNFPPRNRIVSGLADVVVVIEARQQSGTLITVDMALEQGREVYVVPGRITDRLSDGCNKLLKQGAAVLLSPEQFWLEIQELWEKQRGETDSRGAQKDEKKGKPEEEKKGEPEREKKGAPKEEKKGKSEREKERNQAEEKEEVQEKENLKRDTASLGKKRKKRNVILLQKTEKEQDKQDESKKLIPADCKPVYDLLDFYPQSLEQLLEKLPNQYTISTLNTALMRLCLANHAVQVSPGHFCRSRGQE